VLFLRLIVKYDGDVVELLFCVYGGPEDFRSNVGDGLRQEYQHFAPCD
jgi:hypothetical protein